jgi:hypothetical protein
MTDSTYYDKKIAEQLKRIADALEKIAEQRRFQPAIVIGGGPLPSDIQWDRFGSGVSSVGTFTFTPNSDDDMTLVGEPSAG